MPDIVDLRAGHAIPAKHEGGDSAFVSPEGGSKEPIEAGSSLTVEIYDFMKFEANGDSAVSIVLLVLVVFGVLSATVFGVKYFSNKAK